MFGEKCFSISFYHIQVNFVNSTQVFSSYSTHQYKQLFTLVPTLESQKNSSFIHFKQTLLPIIIPLSGVGTCFHHVVIKIRHLFLRPADRQPSLKLDWVLTIANTEGPTA
jgi:predicted ABC-type exoprotein transport system permease subunit